MRLLEVKVSVKLAFEVVSNSALMVSEGFLARYDCAAMALEEMTEGVGMFVLRFNSRECRSAEADCGHVCDDPAMEAGGRNDVAQVGSVSPKQLLGAREWESGVYGWCRVGSEEVSGPGGCRGGGL
jgi:hypothetical protein